VGRDQLKRAATRPASTQNAENPLEARLHFAEIVADFAIEERRDFCVRHGLVVGWVHRRETWILFTQLPPRAGKRQTFDKQQMLEPEDTLDITTPVHPRSSGALGHAEVWKLSLPCAQNVWLDFGNLADFLRSKYRAIRNCRHRHDSAEV
jgi:hypothetical protein